MADIELVIKIPEGLKKEFEFEQWTALSCMTMKNALEKAIQLPKGHRRLIEITPQLEQELFTFTRYTGIDEYPYESAIIITDNAPTVIGADKAESEDR